MKNKIVSCFMILFILSFLCQNIIIASDISANEEIRNDFIYEKGTNVILGYIGDSDICELPEDYMVASPKAIVAPSSKVTKVILNSGKAREVSSLFPHLKEVEYNEGVTEINDGSFSGDSTIEKVTFPSTLKKIGRWVFKDSTALKTIKFAKGLETIGMSSFGGCKMLSGDVIIPDTVTSMGYGVFAGGGDLDNVYLPKNITYTREEGYSYNQMANWFGNEGYNYTKVKKINIPNTILRDKNCQFYADEIIFDGDMTLDIYNLIEKSEWCKNKYLTKKTDKNSGDYKDFVIIENTLVKYIGTNKSPVIPEGVKIIRANAFQLIDIDTVTLPRSLEKIESYAFHETTLKEIRIPANVNTIEEYAFSHCLWLEKVIFEKIPENIETPVFNDSVKLNRFDYRDNIICEDENATIPEKLYSGALSVNIEYLVNAINRVRGTNLKFDYKYIISPSDDTWINDSYMRAEMERLEIFPSDAPTIAPLESTKPVESVKPEESAKPQSADKPMETPVPKTLAVDGNNMSIKIDDNAVDFPDAKPFIDDNDRTQIPIRAVAEMLDCTVDWNKETKTATITNKDGDIVKITIDSSVLTKNNETVQMDTAAIVKDERTYIPIRFVAEAMGLTVEWKN